MKMTKYMMKTISGCKWKKEIQRLDNEWPEGRPSETYLKIMKRPVNQAAKKGLDANYEARQKMKYWIEIQKNKGLKKEITHVRCTRSASEEIPKKQH
jgi:hypothetical protein